MLHNQISMTLKNLFIIFLFLLPVSGYAQDTIYFNMKGEKVKSLKEAHYYTVTSHDQIANRSIERKYSSNHILKSERHLMAVDKSSGKNNKFPMKLDGKYREWYDNGQLRKEIDYKNGDYDGQVLTYWETGELKRQDSFENGKCIGGKCFSSDGKEIEHFPYEIMPQFPGGGAELLRFISRILKYPVEMQRQRRQGKVIVRFVVPETGKVKTIEVIQSAGFEFDEEAVRVVKCLPIWKPGTRDGDIIPVDYTLPITFRLN